MDGKGGYWEGWGGLVMNQLAPTDIAKDGDCSLSCQCDGRWHKIGNNGYQMTFNKCPAVFCHLSA